jgi:hypothetical protein
MHSALPHASYSIVQILSNRNEKENVQSNTISASFPFGCLLTYVYFLVLARTGQQESDFSPTRKVRMSPGTCSSLAIRLYFDWISQKQLHVNTPGSSEGFLTQMQQASLEWSEGSLQHV